MEINLTTLFGIGIAAMFFGYFFGLFEGRRQGYRKRKKEEAVDEPEAPSAPTASPPDSQSERGPALLELGMTDAGRAQLRLDGGEVDSLRVSAAQRRRLIDLMVMLKPWVDSGGAATSTPASATVSRPSPVGRAPVAPTQVKPPAVEKAPSSPQPPPVAPANAQRSLVAQIDAILQVRLAGSPLAERGIRLSEALHGGAIVFVGTHQYDGVDAVPDPEIQGAIRAAIKEWEEKYPPR